MKRLKIGSLILVSALGVPAFAATSVTFEVPGAIYTQPTRINNNGMIAGTYEDANQVWHGFRRTSDGTIVPFDVPSAFSLGVTGLNDQGEIVGVWDTVNGGPLYGFTVSPSGVVATFVPSNTTSIQTAAINNSGTIAGIAYTSSTRIGYIMASNGTFSTFTGPQGSELYSVDAINDSGQIAGVIGGDVLFIRLTDGSYNLKVYRRDGVASSSNDHVAGLNAFGVVAGMREWYYGVPPVNSEGFLFTWDGVTVTSFLRGAVYATVATSINDAGTVAGYGYIDKTTPSSAFIRTSDGTISTFSVGSVSTNPLSINNSGVICGSTVTSSSPNPVGFLYMP